MFHVFADYIKSKVTVSDEELAFIESACFTRKLRKKQYLLQEGDVWGKYAFVTAGLLRTYTVDSTGNEHILSFAMENWWAGDNESLQTGKPTIYNIDAIEDSQVILVNKDDFQRLQKEVPSFSEMCRKILEGSFIASQKRIQVAISYNAQEKYYFFIEKYPEMALRLPQHMIASYLGISPETLSRIRNQAPNKPSRA